MTENEQALKYLRHVGHRIVVVTYARQNVAIECEDCCEVLTDEELAVDEEESAPECQTGYRHALIDGRWEHLILTEPHYTATQ